jgi:uncharacterized membrane protein YphA (DoxX/SURF4 family)
VHRLFVGFPQGISAAGLVLLRLVVGIAIVAEGYRMPGWVSAGSLMVGVAICLGLLTPIAAAIVTGALAVGAYPGSGRPFDRLALAALAIALVLLGPGSISLDFRLFGRREILIPTKRDPFL